MRKEKLVVTKKCHYCKKEYKTKRIEQIYCSRKCHYIDRTANQILYQCEICNKKFHSKIFGRRFCSYKCSGIFWSESRTVKCFCKHCKKEFECQKYQENTRLFCSISCASSYHGQFKEAHLITKKCDHCKKEFSVFPYRRDAKFCSVDCFDNSRRITKICPICEISFTFPKYEAKKFCSIDCAVRGIQRKNEFSKAVISKLKDKIPDIILEEEKTIRLPKRTCFVDILINNLICVECDGQYWHCDDRVYPPNYFHKQIRKTAKEIWKRDDEKAKILESYGYIVLRLKEYDWLISRENTIVIIERQINEILQDKENFESKSRINLPSVCSS